MKLNSLKTLNVYLQVFLYIHANNLIAKSFIRATNAR